MDSAVRIVNEHLEKLVGKKLVEVTYGTYPEGYILRWKFETNDFQDFVLSGPIVFGVGEDLVGQPLMHVCYCEGTIEWTFEKRKFRIWVGGVVRQWTKS